MDHLSRKNISSVLHDVKHPHSGPRAVKKVVEETPQNKKSFHAKLVLVGLIMGLLIGSSWYGLYVFGVTSSIAESVRGWSNNRVDRLSDDLALTPDTLLQLPSFFGDITEVINAIRGISGGINDLNTRGLALVFNGTGGDEFIDILKRIHTNLAILNKIGFDVSDQVSGFVPADDNQVVNFLTDAKGLENGLGAIISFLDVPYDRRVVIFFENQSEIRPSGGFIGSYGELVLDRGSVKDIEVDDIYTPDRNVKYKIVPPRQLQSITIGWGARDANWFFDFPTSAEKVLELLEASEMYVYDGVRFDGAVALNANVVNDILDIVGPIYVPEYDVTLTSDNFLLAVREEVESARDENPKENPKQILDIIAPTIIDRMQNLDENAKTNLVVALIGRAFNKDLKFYFRDEELQEFIEGTPFSGSVYELPEVFNGDYLALVNANVAGGKTDIFIDQTITLNSEITVGGIVKDNLIIERRHFGDGQEQALYRADNQNFIKIFTQPDVVLVSVSGITPKSVKPKINYVEEGYSVDSVLSSVESTRKIFSNLDLESYSESGKNVFAGWFSTPAGETRTLEFNYENEGLFVGSGAKYQFIFDKQSGVESSLNYSVTAPDGYIWRESGGSIYSYSSDLIPGRLVLNLTLVKQRPGS